MAKKLYLISYGCQMNEYDSARMADVLAASHGYERTADPDAADLLLFNTCSVREKAQEKVFSEIGRWRGWKAADPDRLIAVGGCVASQEGAALAARAPLADVVFGPQTLHRLPALVDRARATRRTAIDVSFPAIEKFDALPAPRASGATAFVSVMEGCSKYCSFCVVPYTRGPEVSRPLDDVLAEIATLAAQGVREVTLLGQNVNAYRGATGAGGAPCDLALLLRYAARIPGIERLRFTTSHPAEFGEPLVRAFAEEPKLASYLSLPVQSGSDRILGMMKRGYTRAQYLDKVRGIRAARPGLSLSTDLIVGFPTETETDFEQTLALVDEARFDCAFTFLYSPRPGTPAASLRDTVPAGEKQRRFERLQACIRMHDEAYKAALLGTVERVLVEKPAALGRGQMAGRTSSNRWVNFDAPAALAGHFAEVEITGLRPNSLQGRLAGSARPAAAAVAA